VKPQDGKAKTTQNYLFQDICEGIIRQVQAITVGDGNAGGVSGCPSKETILTEKIPFLEF
jgi:hypothetical protein